ERLLVLCMNNTQKIWFETKLSGKNLTWQEAHDIVANKFNTPLHQLKLYAQVMRMVQKPDESLTAYIDNFLEKKMEAGCEESQALVVAFLSSLLPKHRENAYLLIAMKYGSQCPTDVDAVCDLIKAMASDNKRI
ncbi:hypothetical protein EC973_007384, partial [Apophysomyces ossiformis]